jgi:hypothetical protein
MSVRRVIIVNIEKTACKIAIVCIFYRSISHFYPVLLFAPNQRRVCADGVDKMPGLLFTSENIGWIYVSSQNELEAINWIYLKNFAIQHRGCDEGVDQMSILIFTMET